MVGGSTCGWSVTFRLASIPPVSPAYGDGLEREASFPTRVSEPPATQHGSHTAARKPSQVVGDPPTPVSRQHRGQPYRRPNGDSGTCPRWACRSTASPRHQEDGRDIDKRDQLVVVRTRAFEVAVAYGVHTDGQAKVDQGDLRHRVPSEGRESKFLTEQWPARRHHACGWFRIARISRAGGFVPGSRFHT